MLTHHPPPEIPDRPLDSQTVGIWLFLFLPKDISDMGWGVPVYDSEETAARSPRSSVDIDRASNRRGSIDEDRAPSRKSLDLNYLREHVNNDPPLR
jgi:hypothetical protein